MRPVKIPCRPAPSVEEARLKKKSTNSSRVQSTYNQKKKPPPRPPPPKLNKYQNSVNTNDLLIDFSPPSSPISKTIMSPLSGSCSSSSNSFSASKSSIESDASSVIGGLLPTLASVPTIIRVQPSNSKQSHITQQNHEPINNYCRPDSPPMPTSKPPDLPPYGIVLYDYMGTHLDDLTLQVNDIVFLIRKVSDDWYFGKVDDREGIFPANYIDVQVPLPLENKNEAIAVYLFQAETPYDLSLQPGQKVTVIYKINEDWLYGQSDGKKGQFPASFIDHVPSGI